MLRQAPAYINAIMWRGRYLRWLGLVLVGAWFAASLAGCESSSANDRGNDSSSAGEPADNDTDSNVLVALGDSVTTGEEITGPSYPQILAGLLGKTVVNEGTGGALSSDGVSKINSVLTRYNPSQALILYGINDVIHVGNEDWTIGNLQTMVRACKEYGTQPVLGTIPPRYRGDGVWDPRHTSLNQRIRQLARSEGIPLADVEAEFGFNEALMLPDGYHPNDDGTRIIAFTFYDAVQ